MMAWRAYHQFKMMPRPKCAASAPRPAAEAAWRREARREKISFTMRYFRSTARRRQRPMMLPHFMRRKYHRYEIIASIPTIIRHRFMRNASSNFSINMP